MKERIITNAEAFIDGLRYSWYGLYAWYCWKRANSNRNHAKYMKAYRYLGKFDECLERQDEIVSYWEERFKNECGDQITEVIKDSKEKMEP